MKIAVVLLNLGGPDSPEAVRPFLFNLFNDPAIIRLPGPFRFLLAKLISSRREKKAQAIYAQIGGRSPILPQTQAQAEALQRLLNESGADQWRCFVAMRYWNPRAAQTLEEVINWSPDRVVLLPLYPQFSTTTTASSLREWRSLAAAGGLRAPATAILSWPAQAGWVEAMAEATRQAIVEVGLEVGGKPMVLFSAHGLPQKIVDAGDPYPRQVERSVAAIRARLGDLPFDWRTCYQSRVGPLQWIGPATDDCIAEAAAAYRAIVVVPVAFVSEHSETLVELDIEYRHLAESKGAARYLRVKTVQDDPVFIAALASLARQAATADSETVEGD
ncbi:MAG: ferrochelatase [Reyranellaceae bacterium]